MPAQTYSIYFIDCDEHKNLIIIDLGIWGQTEKLLNSIWRTETLKYGIFCVLLYSIYPQTLLCVVLVVVFIIVVCILFMYWEVCRFWY